MSSSVRVKALPLMLQRWLQDPAALSAIASLALHLPLLLFLPRLFSNAPGLEEPELSSSVDVVELTPAEQGRVPNFQTPEVILPPLAQTPSSLSISPLPKASSPLSESTLPPLSSSNSLWGFGSSFQFPPIGNTSPTFTVPQTQAPFVPYIPYVPPRVTVQPSPRPSVQPTQTPSPVAPDPTATSTPSPQPTATPGAEALGGEAGGQVAASPSPTERSPAQINQELLARNQELRDKLTYNENGTSESDSAQAAQKWAESGQAWLGGDRPINGSIQQGKIDGSYPDAAGYRNLSGTVVVAVLVDDNGKPAPNPTILQSSGYGIFDELALQEAMAQKFEATGKKEAYWIRVTYSPRPVS